MGEGAREEVEEVSLSGELVYVGVWKEDGVADSVVDHLWIRQIDILEVLKTLSNNRIAL